MSWILILVFLQGGQAHLEQRQFRGLMECDSTRMREWERFAMKPNESLIVADCVPMTKRGGGP